MPEHTNAGPPARPPFRERAATPEGESRVPAPQPPFLPMSREEMDALGWDAPDILLVSGDAYVDHPSFGVALLGRFLTGRGFRVGVAAQPRWEGAEALQDIARLGRPRLFAGVTAGAVDSLLARYTAFRKMRSDDAYTPGGKAGARPNRACIVYTGLLRRAFPGLPVVLGGIEASLRRVSHYDFWSDALRRSILLDAKADLLVCGMGESALLGIAQAAKALARNQAGAPPLDRAALAAACRDIPGVAWVLPAKETMPDAAAPGQIPAVFLPSHEDILQKPALLMRATLDMERQTHSAKARVAQTSGDRTVVVNPPAPPLAPEELDALYALPFSRLPHPSHTLPVPAWEMIRTSITTHRGCGGGCSFCSLALHQGRRIASRGRESILAEAAAVARGPALSAAGNRKAASANRTNGRPAAPPRWAGSISDVGGPSANMWRARCALPQGKECARTSCMHPEICPLFQVDQREGVALLRAVAALPGVRHVRIASGVRFDLAVRDAEALRAYTSEFTGGQLKVAPEHSEDAVLGLMRKPSMPVFERFLELFSRHCLKSGKELYTVPYLMSAFPGCTEEHMRRLAAWLKKRNWRPRQVQCFIPTPGTVATAMFYAGIDPDGKALHVARTDKERMRQHYLLTGRGGDGLA